MIDASIALSPPGRDPTVGGTGPSVRVRPTPRIWRRVRATGNITGMSKNPPRSSRQRYRSFVDDYRHGRLDDSTDAKDGRKPLTDGGASSKADRGADAGTSEGGNGTGPQEGRGLLRGKRRQ